VYDDRLYSAPCNRTCSAYPNDIKALKSLLLEQIAVHAHIVVRDEQLEEENKSLTSENRHYQARVLSFQEQHNLLLAKRFGPSREQVSPDQIRLFNETEAATEVEATRALVYIQKLYRIERAVKGASREERYTYRQQHARSLLDKMRGWLDAAFPQVVPQSATCNALNYQHNEWPKLVCHLGDGRLEIDKNRIKITIRPFVVGSKNWTFSGAVNGAKASANLYSLIETAKANSLGSYAYVCGVFTALPRAETVEVIAALLPGNLDKERLNIN